MNFEKEDEEDGRMSSDDLDLDDLDLIDENDIKQTPTDGRYDNNRDKNDTNDNNKIKRYK